MSIRRPAAGILCLLFVGAVHAQEYPYKPIRFVAPSAGGDSDLMARLIGQGVSASLGQQVIVDNKAGGFIMGETVAKAPADGYTLLMGGNTTWITPLLQQTPYDGVKDFAPVTLIARGPNILVINASVAATSVKELIALAKAKPGGLRYSTGSIGFQSHLSAELFKSMAGVNIERVSYATAGLRLTALLSNEVQMEFSGPSAMAHVKAGKLRALAVTSAQPSALLPGLVPISATVPGYEAVGMNGILAPAKTPAPVINKLNREIVRVLNQPDVKQKFMDVGAEVAGNSPEEFATTIRADVAKWGKLIKDAGIRAE